MPRRYNDLNTYLRGLFGCRVQKIPVDAGLTCPNRDGTGGTGGCIYCNAKGSGTGAFARGLSVTEQVQQGKQALSKRYKARKFIVYFQSFSNTYAPLSRLQALYEEALKGADIVGLSVGTRPDCVSEPVIDLLRSYTPRHLIWLEYGLQSAHDSTLKFINRGHDRQAFCRAVKMTRNRGLNVCAHVILGLPGENREHMLTTADLLADLGVDGIKLHLLYVIKGTRLEELYHGGQVRCLQQQEYVELVCDFLERLPQQMVIQRLTGDPHPQELVAPDWALRKNETLTRIAQSFKERNTWQGRALGAKLLRD